MPNLYFVQGSTPDDGESVSLFVRADTPEDAFESWKKHDLGEFGSVYFEEKLSTGPLDDADNEDLRIFLIPDDTLGAIDWHTSNGVQVAGYVEQTDE